MAFIPLPSCSNDILAILYTNEFLVYSIAKHNWSITGKEPYFHPSAYNLLFNKQKWSP